MWLDDAGLRGAPDYLAAIRRMAGLVRRRRASTAVGFGWLSLRHAGRQTPHLTIEEWPYEIEQPLGPHVLGWGARVDTVEASTDADLLRRGCCGRPDLVEERFGRPGDEDPETIVLRANVG